MPKEISTVGIAFPTVETYLVDSTTEEHRRAARTGLTGLVGERARDT